MAFTTNIEVRFADVDWARVVYFARYFDFCHRAVEDFFNAQPGLTYVELLEQRKLGLPIVHAEASYFAPFRLGDTARITLEIVTLSEKSFTSRLTMFRGATEERCAVIQLKQAAIDTSQFRGTRLPDDVVALLRHHVA